MRREIEICEDKLGICNIESNLKRRNTREVHSINIKSSDYDTTNIKNAKIKSKIKKVASLYDDNTDDEVADKIVELIEALVKADKQSKGA